ncbi:MAG: hypothetical protein SGJ19_22040, partial [Planctomycetia bacterium]|nr:hypothetical protein [Planctomycetia bacterium]
ERVLQGQSGTLGAKFNENGLDASECGVEIPILLSDSRLLPRRNSRRQTCAPSLFKLAATEKLARFPVCRNPSSTFFPASHMAFRPFFSIWHAAISAVFFASQAAFFAFASATYAVF